MGDRYTSASGTLGPIPEGQPNGDQHEKDLRLGEQALMDQDQVMDNSVE